MFTNYKGCEHMSPKEFSQRIGKSVKTLQRWDQDENAVENIKNYVA